MTTREGSLLFSLFEYGDPKGLHLLGIENVHMLCCRQAYQRDEPSPSLI